MSIKRLVPLNTVSLPSNPPTAIAGDIYYNSGLSKLLYFNGTGWIELAGSANSLVYAKSIYQDVRNQSGASIPLGTPVYISGAIGASGKILISPASNASEATSSKTMAITTSAISNNSNGQVISEGLLEGIDTTGASDGDPVWLGVNGAKIYGLANKPAAPAHLVFLGIVVNGGSANAGSIFVKIQNGFELEEIHNVSISSLLNGNILAYDSATSTWKNTNTLQSTASTVPLVIKGSASQTANLQEWQNSAGTVLASINPNGGLFIKPTSTSGNLLKFENTGNTYGWSVPANDSNAIVFDVNTDPRIYWGSNTIWTMESAPNSSVFRPYSSARYGLAVRGLASQTGDLQQWQNSAGTAVASINNAGDLTNSGVYTRYLRGGNETFLDLAALRTKAYSPTVPSVVFKGIANQSSHIQQYQNSAGTVLGGTNAAGHIFVGAVEPANGADLYYTWTAAATTSATVATFTSSSTVILASSGQNITTAGFSPAQFNGTFTVTSVTGSSGAYVYTVYNPAANFTFPDSATSTAGTIRTGAGATFVAPTIYSVPVLVKGVGSQATNLTEWQNSAGTVLARVNQNGAIVSSTVGVFGSQTSIANTLLSLYSTIATQSGIVVRGFASQSANLQEWQNSAGTALVNISSSGVLNTNANINLIGVSAGGLNRTIDYGNSYGAAALYLYNGGANSRWGWGLNAGEMQFFATNDSVNNHFSWNRGGDLQAVGTNEIMRLTVGTGATSTLNLNTGGTAATGLVIKGVASQAANLQEWQDSAGTVLVKVDASGNATAASFVKTSGTSSQFLKADGSVDSSTYLTTGTASSTYLPLTGGTVSSDLTVTGNFTVNGTTTNLNSTNLVVEDKNIIVADVATPTDTTADGAGITIKGATDKTLNWVQSTGSFTSSEPFIVNSTSATVVPLIAKAYASQTSNLFEVQNSASNKHFVVKPPAGTALTDSLVFVKGAGTGGRATIGAFSSYGNLGITTNAGQSIVLGTEGGGSNFEVAAGDTYNRYKVLGAGTGIAPILTTEGLDAPDVNMHIYPKGAGKIGINTTTPTGYVHIKTSSASVATLIVQGAASQTANLQEWQNSAGTVTARFTKDGEFFVTDAYVSYFSGASNYSATLNVQTADPTYSGLVIRGRSDQTGDLQKWQNSSGTTLSSITSFGGARLYDLGVKGGPEGIAWAYFGNDNTSTKNVVVRAFASQTANLQEWQNSSGGVDTAVTSTGRLSVRTTLADAGLNVGTPSAATVGQIIRGAASQTADLTQWQDSAANPLAWVNFGGGIRGVSFRTATLNAVNAPLAILATSTTTPAAVIRALASQTANIQEWQNSAGTVLSYIRPGGGIYSTAADDNRLYNLGIGGSSSGISWLYVTPSLATEKPVVIRGIASQSGSLTEWQNNSATVLAKVDANGNFSAISKSFDIPHPTKENMRLRYASLEGNEHGVYVRGTTKEKFIELPEYWTKLVDESTITVSLTSIGKFQKVYVEKIEDNKIYIGGRVKEISYAVFGERKDIDKLIVEY